MFWSSNCYDRGSCYSCTVVATYCFQLSPTLTRSITYISSTMSPRYICRRCSCCWFIDTSSGAPYHVTFHARIHSASNEVQSLFPSSTGEQLPLCNYLQAVSRIIPNTAAAQIQQYNNVLFSHRVCSTDLSTRLHPAQPVPVLMPHRVELCCHTNYETETHINTYIAYSAW